VSVTATIQDETTKNQEYIRKKTPNDELLNECLRQLKPGVGERRNYNGRISLCMASTNDSSKKWLISKRPVSG